MKIIILYISVFLFTVSITAQNVERTFETFNWAEGLPSIKVSDGSYLFLSYSPEIVETIFLPSKEKFDFKNSHAVIQKPDFSSFEVTERDKDILVKTKGIEIIITKSPFQISYYYKDQLITSEKRGYYKSKHEPMDMVKGNIIADSTEKIEFNLTKNEVLYGGGARALGMNRRGNRLPLFNRAQYGYETEAKLMNYTMPIVLSSNKYMIHFDNAPIGYLDLDSKGDNTLTYETISGRKTYQVIVGDSWHDIMNNYTNLTGKQPMLPRWALGNFSSRFGYHSQEEVEMTIDKFKEEEIPVDAIILDLYWFGKELKGTMGNLEVFRDSFPDFEGMVKRLNNKGVKTITITEPFILTTSSKWDEAVKEDILAKDSIGNPAKYDFYFGNTGLIDIYKPEGEQWFWNIYKDLANKGVAGIWGDLGEPEVHPNWVQHHTGSAAEVHNIYGHDWARLVYEGYKRDFPDARPFILMRAGYSGSQRYGMVPWSGDVNRTWGGLQSQPEIALQMGMQGLAYMHSDLGGFAGANLDDELYVRWLQYGVFNPIFRPHAQEDVPSEPIFRSEKAKALAKEAIELRYKLLPYNYNLVYQNHKDGTPLMRPLFFEESKEILLTDNSIYFWGKDFLVSPVTYAKAEKQVIYFPKSSNWFDFYSDKIYKAGSVAGYDLKESSIPTFVRAGAFIPMAKSMQSTSEYDGNSLTLHYYHDESVAESERAIYNDDGKTSNAIENKQYEILEFEAERKGSWLKFEFDAESGSGYKPQTKDIDLVIHNIKKAPKGVKINGKNPKFDSKQKLNYTNLKGNGERVYVKWDSEKKTLTMSVIWDTSKEQKIKIKLKR